MIRTTTEYLRLLSMFMKENSKRYHITRIGIFGSVVRGEQTEDSDIDICFEGDVPNLFTLSVMKNELEELFGKTIDLIRMRDSMDEYLKKEILKDIVYAG